MSIFVTTTKAPIPRNNVVRIASVLAAAVFVVMATAQLFAYERFPAVMSSYWLGVGQNNGYVLAAVLVAAEVFALPFLLFMRVSPLMRVLSMVCGWGAAFAWLLLSIWPMTTVSNVTNSGLLGADIRTPAGWGQVVVMALLVLLVVFVSWGQWPVLRHPR